LGNEYRSFSSSFCNFFHSPATLNIYIYIISKKLTEAAHTWGPSASSHVRRTTTVSVPYDTNDYNSIRATLHQWLQQFPYHMTPITTVVSMPHDNKDYNSLRATWHQWPQQSPCHMTPMTTTVSVPHNTNDYNSLRTTTPMTTTVPVPHGTND
jgi:hypothetical protein